MSLQVIRASAEHLDAVAELFDGYRGFYGQPSNLAQSGAFITYRMAGDESMNFLVGSANGHHH